MFNDTTSLLKSMITDDVYTEIETALCIWEWVIEEACANNSNPYEWFTQEQGVYYGRQQAIELAYLVDLAYQTGNGNDYALDGPAFDWEIVPAVIAQFMERTDRPSAVSEAMAIEVGKMLPDLLQRADTDPAPTDD